MYESKKRLDSLIQVIDDQNDWSPSASHDGDQVNETIHEPHTKGEYPLPDIGKDVSPRAKTTTGCVVD
jgi:hypothetical protein